MTSKKKGHTSKIKLTSSDVVLLIFHRRLTVCGRHLIQHLVSIDCYLVLFVYSTLASLWVVLIIVEHPALIASRSMKSA